MYCVLCGVIRTRIALCLVYSDQKVRQRYFNRDTGIYSGTPYRHTSHLISHLRSLLSSAHVRMVKPLCLDLSCADTFCLQRLPLIPACSVFRRFSHWLSPRSKLKPCKSRVISTLYYGCELCTLRADSANRIQAFETKCPSKLLCISYLKHETKD